MRIITSIPLNVKLDKFFVEMIPTMEEGIYDSVVFRNEIYRYKTKNENKVYFEKIDKSTNKHEYYIYKINGGEISKVRWFLVGKPRFPLPPHPCRETQVSPTTPSCLR